MASEAMMIIVRKLERITTKQLKKVVDPYLRKTLKKWNQKSNTVWTRPESNCFRTIYYYEKRRYFNVDTDKIADGLGTIISRATVAGASYGVYTSFQAVAKMRQEAIAKDRERYGLKGNKSLQEDEPNQDSKKESNVDQARMQETENVSVKKVEADKKSLLIKLLVQKKEGNWKKKKKTEQVTPITTHFCFILNFVILIPWTQMKFCEIS